MQQGPRTLQLKTWQKICLIPLALYGALLLVGLFWAGNPAPPTTLFTQGHPLVFAHGGGQGLAAPNSLGAMEASWKLGTDFLEGDLHQTSDGHLVLMHDETVDRTTNGTGAIEDMTLASLRSLSLSGSKGESAPTLEEALTRFSNANFLFEIKKGQEEIPSRLCATLQSHDMLDAVVVASFHHEPLLQFRKACPDVVTSLSRKEATRFILAQKIGLAWLVPLRGSALHVPEKQGNIRVVTLSLMRTANRRGLDVHVWTVNEEDQMERLLDLGVHGLMTDYPGRAQVLIEKRQAR